MSSKIRTRNYTCIFPESLRNFLPLFRFRAFQYGFADLLSFERIPEGWAAGRAGLDSFDEIGNLMHECVLISDLQTRNPPFAHVWHVAVGHMNGMPAANQGIILMVEVFEPMQVMEIPLNRSVLTVDLKRIQSLMASCVSS